MKGIKAVPLFFLFLTGLGQVEGASIKVVDGYFKAPKFREKLQVVDKPLLYNNGILFTHYGHKDDKVYLSGDFNEWGEKISMKKDDQGVFYYLLNTPLEKGIYTYRFMVNGIWINDQEQSFYKVDIHNQRVSYFRLPHNIRFNVQKSPEPLPNGKYRFYIKDDGYRNVSLITDANRWEPGFTPMTLENGYWYVDYNWGNRRLQYAYMVDGEKKLDTYNLNRTLTFFNLEVNFYFPPQND